MSVISGGFIQQPLMDREFISIGGSSLEDTRHGASHNDSFFSERVSASCRTSGSASHLRGRARPFIFSREPVPINMILPLFASRGVRRGSSGGDVKASPRVRHSHGAGLPSSPPIVTSYEWVKDNVLKYKSSFTFAASVTTLQRGEFG